MSDISLDALPWAQEAFRKWQVPIADTLNFLSLAISGNNNRFVPPPQNEVGKRQVATILEIDNFIRKLNPNESFTVLDIAFEYELIVPGMGATRTTNEYLRRHAFIEPVLKLNGHHETHNGKAVFRKLESPRQAIS